jgi:hypothetical protein
MKLRLLALAAAAATTFAATGALANPVTITAVAGVNITDPLITDFNSDDGNLIIASGYTFAQDAGGLSFIRDGVGGLLSGVSAPPPADNGVAGSFYETVEGGGSATLTAAASISNFQFYMGSPDSFNSMTIAFVNPAMSPLVLSGEAIWGGTPPGNGDQSEGFTVNYHFDAPVKSITFASNTNSFEFDKLAGGVPEPASWALMILGFGGAGAMVRNRRRQTVAAAA